MGDIKGSRDIKDNSPLEDRQPMYQEDCRGTVIARIIFRDGKVVTERVEEPYDVVDYRPSDHRRGNRR